MRVNKVLVTIKKIEFFESRCIIRLVSWRQGRQDEDARRTLRSRGWLVTVLIWRDCRVLKNVSKLC